MHRLLIPLSLLLLTPSLFAVDVKKEDVQAYRKLRMEFAQSENFNPIALQLLERKMADRAVELWKEGKAGDAVYFLNELLSHYPLSMEAQIRLADGYKVLLDSGDTEDDLIDQYVEAERNHRYVYEGLIQSVLVDADGKTPETAFKIITPAEEIWVLRHLRLKGLQRIEDPDLPLVAYEAVDREGTPHTVYFDVSIILDAMKRVAEATKEEKGEAKD